MKCSFCSDSLPAGAGKMLVKLDGTVLYFCGSKCEKNKKLGRQGKKFKWTQTSRSLRKPGPKPPAKKAAPKQSYTVL